MNKSILIVGLLVLVAAAAGAGYFYWPFNDRSILTFPGIVEIQEVRLGSKIGGRVAQVLVREGIVVSRGQQIVILEAPELENQRAQLKARLDQAKADRDRVFAGEREEAKVAARAAAKAAEARSLKMAKGWREEEKRWARSELETADADLKQSIEDLTRIADLYRTKSVARVEYDSAMAARDRSRGRFNVAKAKNDMYQIGNRPEDIAEAEADAAKAKAKADELDNGSRAEDKALAQAKLDEAKAKLQEVEINLKEAVVLVPDAPQFQKAVVEVLAVRPGDIVSPSQPVVRMLCADDLWVKIYVPETKYGKVTLNQKVEVRIDSEPNKVFEGVVIQRASISEFTPRNVQSVDERRHQVFGVKIRVEDPQGVLNAGMAAEVRIPLQ